jgi:hypothetical protein
MSKSLRFPTIVGAAVATTLLAAAPAFAGQASASGKMSKEPEPMEQYEAGRGLITLEGPSGMFINPTSATLPKGAYTFQYCLLFPNTDSEIIGQGIMTSFGITDWLEIGGLGNYIIANRDKPTEREFGLGGPLIRLRLLKDESWWPQLSIGGYGKYGTSILEQTTAFAAAYKRIPITEDGFLKSFGVHLGVRSSWFHKDAAESNSVDGYLGGELQLPARLYVVSEVGTRGKSSGGNFHRIPYSFGLQWRLAGVSLSTAMIQRGNDNELSYWFGVGTGWQF